MSTKTDLVNFLKTNTFINKLNFSFKGYKVYPSAYQKDVAGSIDSEAIILGSSPSGGRAVATYWMDQDRLDLDPGFTITNVSHQALLVHECTHAHLDIQASGSGSAFEHEAVGYLAEALFLEANGSSSLGGTPIRIDSHRIAKILLSGSYFVSASDVTALTAAVAAEPHYASKPPYESNGFNRNVFKSVLRRF